MLVFFIVIIIINIALYFSKVIVEISELKINTRNEKDKVNYRIKIYLVVAKKIKWLKLEINKEKIKNNKVEKIFKKILNSKKIKKIRQNNFNKNKEIVFNVLKNIKIKLEKIEIKGTIALNNVIALAYLVAVLNIILSIVLSKYSVKLKDENYYYEIIPKQTNKSYLELSINCIISIKIANIINMIIKKRSEEYNEGTSYRKFNGNCHAKYPRYG